MNAPVLAFRNRRKAPTHAIVKQAAILAELDPESADVLERMISSTIRAVSQVRLLERLRELNDGGPR